MRTPLPRRRITIPGDYPEYVFIQMNETIKRGARVLARTMSDPPGFAVRIRKFVPTPAGVAGVPDDDTYPPVLLPNPSYIIIVEP